VKLWARVSCLIFLRHSVCLDRFSCFCTVHPYTQPARRQTNRQTHRQTHTQIYRPSNVGYMSRIYATHAIRPKISSVLSFDNRVIHKDKCVFGYLRTLTTWHCPHLLVDISCSPSPQQQTCSSGCAAVGPYWDIQTDGPMDGHSTVPSTLLRALCGECQIGGASRGDILRNGTISVCII